MPEAKLQEKIEELSTKIVDAELWLMDNIESLEDDGTAAAGVKIATVNSRIQNWQRAKCTLLGLFEEKSAAIKFYADMAQSHDRAAKEWEQQRARMLEKIKIDLLPKVRDEIASWQTMGSTMTAIQEDPGAPVVPRV